ncbi:NAD-dependent epimerase/dehydratase family protein, partial [Acinetobacter baumannii]
RKFITAKKNNQPTVTLWGSGSPRREFLHTDDLAEACIFLMNNYNEKGLVNIGWGDDVTILELARLIKKIAGYEGELIFDT